MIKKLLKLLYLLLIFIVLYFPFVLYLKNFNYEALFNNRLLNKTIIITIIISSITALITNVLSIIISRYYHKKKLKYSLTILFPIIFGIIIYLINANIHINNYVLLVLCYITMITPIISYLEYNYILNMYNKNKDVLRSFGKIEYLRLLDKQIMLNYFIVFAFVYTDNFVTSFIFNKDVNMLSNYVILSVKKHNYSLLSNAFILSFLVFALLLLVLYMINYELKLRSRHEKDN